MGGFFGVVSKTDAMSDTFFGTDYHSHLGTRRGGMAAYDEKIGLQREIHNIQNSPFRTKFESIFYENRNILVEHGVDCRRIYHFSTEVAQLHSFDKREIIDNVG